MNLLKILPHASRFFILVVISLTQIACASTASKDDNWFGKDKAYHFAASALIGAGASSAAKNNNRSHCEAATTGISISLVVGAGKEYHDKHNKKSGWSWKDMFWNLVGGTAGSLAATGCH